MGKTAIDAKRGTVFMMEPERLTLVTDKMHPLYDPRVEDEPSESMIANIATYGVLEPVIVRKNGEAIEVVAGRSRIKSALEVNKRFVAEGKMPILVPAILRGGSDSDLFGVLISENEIRRDDNAIKKGEKARKLLNMGYTVAQIAVTFGVTYQTVGNWLKADELPEPIKEAVLNDEISATAAIRMSDMSNDQQVDHYDNIKKSGLKPTVENVGKTVLKTKGVQVNKMRSKREIEEKIVDFQYEGQSIYAAAFIDALKWVLNREDEGGQ